jgi:hypothetical protein
MYKTAYFESMLIFWKIILIQKIRLKFHFCVKMKFKFVFFSLNFFSKIIGGFIRK